MAEAFSKYACPILPREVYIGQTIDDDWFIWPEKQAINSDKLQFYKNNKQERIISKWQSFPSGERVGNFSGYKYYIGCCTFNSNNGEELCAYKTVRESNCRAHLPSSDPVKFVCKKWPKSKLEEWMERDRLASK